MFIEDETLWCHFLSKVTPNLSSKRKRHDNCTGVLYIRWRVECVTCYLCVCIIITYYNNRKFSFVLSLIILADINQDQNVPLSTISVQWLYEVVPKVVFNTGLLSVCASKSVCACVCVCVCVSKSKSYFFTHSTLTVSKTFKITTFSYNWLYVCFYFKLIFIVKIESL